MVRLPAGALAQQKAKRLALRAAMAEDEMQKAAAEALRVKLRKQGKIELQGVYSQDEGERTAAASVAGVITAMDGLPPKSVPNRFQFGFLIGVFNSILRLVPK